MIKMYSLLYQMMDSLDCKTCCDEIKKQKVIEVMKEIKKNFIFSVIPVEMTRKFNSFEEVLKIAQSGGHNNCRDEVIRNLREFMQTPQDEVVKSGEESV